MDKDTAREIIRAAFRAGTELEKLLPAIKARCGADEFKELSRQVGRAIDGIDAALLDHVLAQFPELNAEVEAMMAAGGKART